MSETDWGAACLIPTALVFSLALWTRRPIESLVSGSLLGLVMLNGMGFIGALAETSVNVMTDPDVAWVILVCGLMGGVIGLLIRTGATASFTRTVESKVTGERSALMSSWVLGILMFVDDYLNSLAVGSAMRDITDRFRVARERLAYVVDSTAAPISVIIPYSTWGAFFAGLLVANGLAEEGDGLNVYISAIPYMFYAWASVLIVPLVIAGWIPSLGAMRSADRRARDEGLMVPPEAAHIEAANQSILPKESLSTGIWFFIVSMAVLVLATVLSDNDFLVGLYITLGAMVLFVLLSKSLNLQETFDTVLDGFKTMLEPLAVLVAAFIFKEVNDGLGLAPYVVNALEPILSAETLPAAIFVVMALVSFLTGSNWGVFVIVLPIVTALGQGLNADMTLLIGATLSASTFGSHACFYSDATVLTAQATGCTPLQHALTQLPYALIAAAIAVIGYLIIGFA